MGRRKVKGEAKPAGITIPGFTGLLISTPCYGGVVTNVYLHSIQPMITMFLKLGLKVTLLTLPDEAVISRARDQFMAWFAASAHSHMLCIDADVQWAKEDVIRLMLCGHEFIMGSYPRKIMPDPGKPMSYPVVWRLPGEDGKLETCPTCGAIRIDGGPAGFMMVRKSVAEKMTAAYPEFKYEGLGKFPEQDKHLHAFYNPILENGVLWSEDLSFCRRWSAIGGEIWLDPTIKLNHQGQYLYRGNIEELMTTVPVEEVKDDATHAAL